MAWLRGPLLALVLGVLGAVETIVVFGVDGARLLLVAGLSAPLAWRRSHPVRSLLVISGAFVVQLPWSEARIFDQTFVGYVCLIVGAYFVGRYGVPPAARAVGVGTAAAGGVVIGVTDQDLISGLLATGILVTPVWVGESVRERAAGRRVLADQAREITASMAAVASARALEARAFVAADVQAALVIRVRRMADGARRAAGLLAEPGATPEVTSRAIAVVENEGREALAEMRCTLGVLRAGDAALPAPKAGGDPETPPPAPAAHPWLFFTVAGYALVETAVLHGSSTTPLPVTMALGLAMASTVAARHSRPIAAAVVFWALACVYVSLLTVPTVVVIIGMVLAGSAGSLRNHRRRGAGLLVAFGGVAAVNLADGSSGVGDYVFPAVLMTLAWFGGSVVRQQEELSEEVAVRAGEVRRLRDARSSAAAVEERLRLARELHDVVAHHLMVMVVQAGAARRSVESGRKGAEGALRVIEHTADETLGEIGSLLDLVDPATRSGPAHGMADLDRMVSRVRAGGLDVDLHVVGQPCSLPGGLDIAAHRIVQESLTNAIRHAGASRVQVRVSYLPGQLVLEITDDGRGLEPGRQMGLGVTGMCERAQLYGGSCEVSQPADGGVRIVATLPVAQDRALA